MRVQTPLTLRRVLSGQWRSTQKRAVSSSMNENAPSIILRAFWNSRSQTILPVHEAPQDTSLLARCSLSGEPLSRASRSASCFNLVSTTAGSRRLSIKHAMGRKPSLHATHSAPMISSTTECFSQNITHSVLPALVADSKLLSMGRPRRKRRHREANSRSSFFNLSSCCDSVIFSLLALHRKCSPQ
eukprot:3337210-Prymnesium_polylepis.1